MSKFLIRVEEVIKKEYEIEVEAPEGVTESQMDALCDKLEKNEFVNHMIEELKSKGYKITDTTEGVENGELEISELDKV